MYFKMLYDEKLAHTRLLDRLEHIPTERPILVHCLGGVRSAYAVGMLRSHGFDVTQLDGGYKRWVNCGGAVVKGEADGA